MTMTTTFTTTTPARILAFPASLLARESRPVVQVVFLLRFVVAAALTVSATAVPWSVVAPGVARAAIGWSLLTVGVYLWNAATDRDTDALNGKGRPLSSGLLSVQLVRRASLGSTALGLVLVATAGAAVLLLGGAFALAGWAYSSGPRPLKQSAHGASAVAALGGFLTFCAGAAACGGLPTGPVLGCAVVMSLWMGVAGSSKDFADVAGDTAAGRRTLPVVVGDRTARLVVAGASTALAAAAAAVALAHGRPLLGLLALVPGSAVLVVHAFRPGRPRTPYRAFMVTQYVAISWTGLLALA